MGGTEAQIQFAGEFVVFLVAIAAVAVLALRAETVVAAGLARAALVTGFVSLAAAAFLNGSLLVANDTAPAVLAPSLAGIALVVAGTTQWRARTRSRMLMWVGSGLVTAAVVVSISGAEVADAALKATGGFAIGAALVAASRRSIVARIATSAAATLLLVVLVLSIALSAVLASTVEDEAVRRLAELGQIESREIAEIARRDAVRGARFVARVLVENERTSQELLARRDLQAHSDIVEEHLEQLREQYLSEDLALAYLNANRTVIAATEPLVPSEFTPLAGSATVRAVTVEGEDAVGTPEIVAGQAMAIAAVRVSQRSEEGGRSLLGVVVASVVLDENYLSLREQSGTTLMIVAPSGVLSRDGRVVVDESEVRAVADEVVDTGRSQSAVLPEAIIVAQPIDDSLDRTVFAFVAVTSSTAVASVQESLFRTLFLIALGGAVLSLALAAFVGDRIGAGLRRLTDAAEAIQRGEAGVRANIVSEDEVGVLGGAFDAMVESNEEKEAALRQAAHGETRLRNRLEAIVAGMGEALIAVDADGRVSDFNHAAVGLVGKPAELAVGRRADEVVRVRTEEGVDLGARMAAPGERWSEIAYLTSITGEEIPVAASAGVLEGPDGEVVGGVFVLRDLRQEREIERIKTEFLSRVGHELRTPLVPILGYAQMLSNRELAPERVRELGGHILGSADRLGRIIELLVFFATSQAGRTVLRPEPLDVRSLIDDVVEGWERKLDDDHRLRRRVARTVRPLMADRKWISMSLAELIDNAVKFSPEGGTISVVAEPSINGVSGVRISVADQGKGMTQDEIESAFTDFSQGDESDTRAFGGLGLGLALVREVVERHGGEVIAESAGPDKGSKVSIFLPSVPIDTHAGSGGRDRHGPDGRGRRRLRRDVDPD